jgi:hypothetical protein
VVTYATSADTVLITFPPPLGGAAWTDTGTVTEDRTHILVRARMPHGARYVSLDLLYGKVP